MKALIAGMALFSATVMLEASTLADEHDTNHSAEKLKPSVRVVERDWDYFSSVSCQHIDQLSAQNSVEERLIAKRKQQCLKKQLDRYDAFLPKH